MYKIEIVTHMLFVSGKAEEMFNDYVKKGYHLKEMITLETGKFAAIFERNGYLDTAEKEPVKKVAKAASKTTES